MLISLMVLAATANSTAAVWQEEVSSRTRAAIAAYDSNNCVETLRLLSPLLLPDKSASLGEHAASIYSHAASCEWKAQRTDKAYELAVRGTKNGNGSVFLWRARIVLATQARKYPEAVEAVEELANGDGAILNRMEMRNWWALNRALLSPGNEDLRFRFLGVLAHGFSPDPLEGDADPFRLRYAQMLLRRGDIKEVRKVLEGVTLPSALQDVMIDPELRKALPPGFDIRTASERQLAADRALVDLNPDRLSPVLEVATDLRRLGRAEEALKVLDNVRAKVVAGTYSDISDYAIWWWDGRSRSLRMLGRIDEAAESLQAGMKLNENGGQNVSQVINLMHFYDDVGRPQDALRVLREVGKLEQLSGYGEMEFRFSRGCAHVLSGAPEAAEDDRAYIMAHKLDAPEVYIDMMLCTGDFDGTAGEVIARLADPERRVSALERFSTFAPPPVKLPVSIVERNWKVVAARPDVQAALNKAGGGAFINVYRD